MRFWTEFGSVHSSLFFTNFAAKSGHKMAGPQRKRSSNIKSGGVDQSDSEDHFQISHEDVDSDSSDSDSDEESRSSVVSSQHEAQNQDEQVRDPTQWIEVSNETDERPDYPINFTITHPKSAKKYPRHSHIIFFPCLLMTISGQLFGEKPTGMHNSSWALQQSLSGKSGIPQASRSSEWPADGTTIKQLKKFIGLSITWAW